jgi:hypothetical protein
MTGNPLEFDPTSGILIVCGAHVQVGDGRPRIDDREWRLVEMERGYSRKECREGTWSAWVWCRDGVPDAISISVSQPGDEHGWDGWSLEREHARKRANDEATIAAFGAVEKTFEWGTVQSRYDARTGGASITVAFRRESLWKRFTARLRSTVFRRRS